MSVRRPVSGSVNEKSVGDGSTSAIRTNCLNLVERLFTSLLLVEAYQRQLVEETCSPRQTFPDLIMYSLTQLTRRLLILLADAM